MARTGFVAAVRSELATFFGQLQAMPVLVFLTAGIALWAYDYYGSTLFFQQTIAPAAGVPAEAREAGSYFYWFGAAFVLLMVLPQIVWSAGARALPDQAPETMGWGLGDWRIGVPACAIFYAVMLPLLATVVWLGDFQEYYPIYGGADRTLAMFVAYEAAYALYFVAWEYYFRGFLTLGLYRSIGIWAIFVQMLPFAVMHFGKPSLEALSSIFGGIALGYLAIRTRSFWYGVFIHAATAVTLDLLVVGVRRWGGAE